IRVQNAGRADLTISATLDSDGGSEFALGTVPTHVPAGNTLDVPVTFSPLGAGEDVAGVVFTSDDPEHLMARVRVHGGPIFPLMEFDPDGGFLSFAPTSMAFTSKYALVRSVGGSTLHVSSVGVDPSGSPDFSVT